MRAKAYLSTHIVQLGFNFSQPSLSLRIILTIIPGIVKTHSALAAFGGHRSDGDGDLLLLFLVELCMQLTARMDGHGHADD